MPTEEEVRETVEDGMREFQASCEMAHQITFNWVVYPANKIAEQQGKLMDAAIKLSILQSQGADTPEVRQAIMLCKGGLQSLTQDALKGERRRQEKFPFEDFLRTLQPSTGYGSAGGS